MKKPLNKLFPYPEYSLFSLCAENRDRKEEIKKNVMLWIEALKSGKYKQGHRYLHNVNDNTYCCLGVAKEVCNIESEGELLKTSAAVNKLGLIFGRGKFFIRSSTIFSLLGLQDLTSVNDSRYYSFEEIAEFIEHQFNKFEESLLEQ